VNDLVGDLEISLVCRTGEISPSMHRGEPGSLTVEGVSFGMIVPATLIIVDEFPRINTGVEPDSVTEFISDDGAIVAANLTSCPMPRLSSAIFLPRCSDMSRRSRTSSARRLA
jgi:hypothetical protein